jgi:hypothetical protein
VARDDAAAGQPEFDALELPVLGKLERRARLQRPALAVREADETGLRRRERVAARRQVGEVERAVFVGQRAAPAGQLRRRDEDARPLDRAAGVGGEDPPGQPADCAGVGWPGWAVCADATTMAVPATNAATSAVR